MKLQISLSLSLSVCVCVCFKRKVIGVHLHESGDTPYVKLSLYVVCLCFYQQQITVFGRLNIMETNQHWSTCLVLGVLRVCVCARARTDIIYIYIYIYIYIQHTSVL